MKKSFFNFEFKSVEVKDGKVKIKGFASTPDIDRYDDIVDTKAFDSSIATYMKNPIILLQHDSDKPIGKCISYTLDEKGLEITAEITENTDGVMDKLNNKVLGAFSIGFIAKEWNFSEKEVNGKARRIREIKDIDLVEISIVSTPANQNAIFSITKSLKKMFDTIEKEDEELLEQEEKGMKKPKKPRATKKEFEEKRITQASEVAVGDLVRFTNIEYDMWEGETAEIETGEILKIIETEDITNPTLYILEYELTLDGYVPGTEIYVKAFRETTLEKITEMQLKKSPISGVEQDSKSLLQEKTIEYKEEGGIIDSEPLKAQENLYGQDSENNINSEEKEENNEENTQKINQDSIENEEEQIEKTAEIPPEMVEELPADNETAEVQEVEKYFVAKSLELKNDFNERLKTLDGIMAKFYDGVKAFDDVVSEKLNAIEKKEADIKSEYNEIVSLKKESEKNLEESKKLVERLLKIATNKGIAVVSTKAYPNYFNHSL